MAHDLATIGGRVTMAYLGETPWHGLGTKIDPDLATDPDRVLIAAGLNFTTELQPVYLKDGREVPDRRAVTIAGDARILGTVGADYTAYQNSEAIGVFRELCGRLGARIETAGALGHGAECWALASVPGATVDPLGNGDIVNGYFLARWGHTGNLALTGHLTQIRVVCRNTMRLALAALGKGRKPGQVYRLIHSASIADHAREAEALIAKLTDAAQANGETFADLARRQMSAREIGEYIAGVFPADEDGSVSPILAARRKSVAALVWAGHGAELAGATADGATAWAAFNAVTEYFDHVRPAEAKSDSARKSAQTSALFGEYDAIKVRAFAAARALVAA